jgi:hypothetical protein
MKSVIGVPTSVRSDSPVRCDCGAHDECFFRVSYDLYEAVVVPSPPVVLPLLPLGSLPEKTEGIVMGRPHFQLAKRFGFEQVRTTDDEKLNPIGGFSGSLWYGWSLLVDAPRMSTRKVGRQETMTAISDSRAEKSVSEMGSDPLRLARASGVSVLRVSTARTIAKMMTTVAREKTLAKANFCRRVMWSDHRIRMGNAMIMTSDSTSTVVLNWMLIRVRVTL